jgi:esterase
MHWFRNCDIEEIMSSNPVTLRAQISGNPDASPIILLHGLFGMSDNLGNLSRFLSDHYAVYRLDLRNHGQSPWCDEISLLSMAEDVAEFCRAQNLSRVSLLGHSLGGKVAMQFALSHPSLVNALVVADIAPVTYTPHHNEILHAMSHLDLSTISSRQQADQRLAEEIDDAFVRQFLLKNLYRDESGKFALRMNLPVLAEQYDHLRMAPQGEPFTGPCLFVKGELSAYIQQKHADAIKHLFPAAQLKIIQGTGHYLHSEKPTAFNHIVGRFFDDVLNKA